MLLIIEAPIDDGEDEAERDGGTIVATVDRRDKDLSKLGLPLAEGRCLRLGASHGFARSRGGRDKALAMDGKTMKNALDEAGQQNHIMSLLGHDSATCYAQKKSVACP